MGRDSAEFYLPQPWPDEGAAKDQPWLRWSTEPFEAYGHFQCFRDLPPTRRTMAKAYEVYRNEPVSRVPHSWHGQARKWHWKERVEKYDAWREKSQLEAERDGTLEAWREMGERHAREAMALQQKALERLRMLNPAELSAAEVRQFLVQAATLERLARGASLQDMARVQREKEQEAARDGVAVITYVDDWRGDSRRAGARNQNSFYGNGQGELPERIEHGPAGLPLVRPDGTPTTARGFQTAVPIPAAPPGADGGAAPAPPVHLPQRRKKVAQDHPGDDAGRGGRDPG